MYVHALQSVTICIQHTCSIFKLVVTIAQLISVPQTLMRYIQ